MSAAATVTFRAGGGADQATLWAVRTRCVRELCCSHYPPDVIERWAASGPPPHHASLLGQGGCVVAEDARGRVLGYGVLDLPRNEVDALFVEPGSAGQGIGHALMQRLTALADPQRDLALSASLNAVAFYQRQGFVIEGAQDYPHPSGMLLAAMRMRRRPTV